MRSVVGIELLFVHFAKFIIIVSLLSFLPYFILIILSTIPCYILSSIRQILVINLEIRSQTQKLRSVITLQMYMPMIFNPKIMNNHLSENIYNNLVIYFNIDMKLIFVFPFTVKPCLWREMNGSWVKKMYNPWDRGGAYPHFRVYWHNKNLPVTLLYSSRNGV